MKTAGKYIRVATTDIELAKRVGDAFHSMTGFSMRDQKDGKLFVVSSAGNDKISRHQLKRVAENIIREDDVAIIILDRVE